jgi:spoIIIJ-associated protein
MRKRGKKKMPKSVITEGKTSTEAIEKGLKELNVSKNQVEIKILEEKKKSFFSILDPHVVKVELTLKENAQEGKIVEKKKNDDEKVNQKKKADQDDLESAKASIETFLNEFLTKISPEITYKIEIKEDVINVVVDGNESTKLIGYRGEALNSLQIILSTIANKNKDAGIKVILDIGNYKDTRKATLEELAGKLERTVMKSGKSVTLEPMTAYERKIIHTKLQNSEFVRTYSIGEDDRRRIVIAKK